MRRSGCSGVAVAAADVAAAAVGAVAADEAVAAVAAAVSAAAASAAAGAKIWRREARRGRDPARLRCLRCDADVDETSCWQRRADWGNAVRKTMSGTFGEGLTTTTGMTRGLATAVHRYCQASRRG